MMNKNAVQTMSNTVTLFVIRCSESIVLPFKIRGYTSTQTTNLCLDDKIQCKKGTISSSFIFKLNFDKGFFGNSCVGMSYVEKYYVVLATS